MTREYHGQYATHLYVKVIRSNPALINNTEGAIEKNKRKYKSFLSPGTKQNVHNNELSALKILLKCRNYLL